MKATNRDGLRVPKAGRVICRWWVVSLAGFVVLSGSFVAGRAGATSQAEIPRLVITPRQPTEQDPIYFHIFLGGGVPCDTAAANFLPRVRQTIAIDAVVNRFQGICIQSVGALLTTQRLDRLPAGHYVVEVYRTEHPRPGQRELWARAEFDVVKDRTMLESEPNNLPSQANEAIPNMSIVGSFDQPGDSDLFRVDATGGERLNIDVAAERLDPPSLADPIVTVFDPAGNPIAVSDNLGRSLDPLLDVPVPHWQNGAYRVEIRDQRGGGPEARYRITIRATRASPEREPNDSFEGTDFIYFTSDPAPTIFGDLNLANDVDFFGFRAEKDQLIEIDVDARSLRRPSDASIILTLFDENERVLAESRGSEESPDPLLRFQAPSSGEFYFRLRNAVTASSTNFRYDVTVRVQ
jgi:hypothetical protein